MERPQEEIEWHFERFCELIQKMQDERTKISLMEITYKVRVRKGHKYWKIFIDEEEYVPWLNENTVQRAGIFGFVRRKDGAIFRAASYKSPETRTKSAIRGYVYDPNPEEYFTEYGIIYAEGT